ncbi:MAG: hypothetical protein V4568_10480 [Pseudomonadota bacterium]
MNAEPNTQEKLTDTTREKTQVESGSTGHSRHVDARRDKSQLKKNQERLGVDADHKTSTMKKNRRGTYP